MATYTVTNGNDAGAGSLRQAIIDANGNAGADIINIQDSVTLINTTSLLSVTDDVTINGATTGTEVRGDGTHVILEFDSNTSTINRCTIADGSSAGNGAGIINDQSDLTLNYCTIRDCTASRNTAIDLRNGATTGTTTVTLNNSTITGNSASSICSGVGFRDVVSVNAGNLEINLHQSTISGNTALLAVGISIITYYSTEIMDVNIYNSDIVFNTSTAVAGQPLLIFSTNASTAYIRSTSISDTTYSVGVPTPISGGSFDIGTTTVLQDAPGVGIIGTPIDSSSGLNSLANNGGLTLTHTKMSGSVTLLVGENPQGFVNDQRGAGFPRETDGGDVDIGATQYSTGGGGGGGADELISLPILGAPGLFG